MYPAVPLLDKMALEDVVIPVSDSIATSAGTRINHIHIRKGESVSVAIASYQRFVPLCTLLVVAHLFWIQDDVALG